ncbi:tail fiber protein [Xanthobacter sp. DSM 24535]|uniref:phage tail protein n=1 Tax=Roseixanthobacter psychrophilus TaxID=3119917 RepID=UPI00372CE637
MDGYIGEVRLFGFDYPTESWMLCHGQTLPIAAQQALYSVIGTNFGGNGTTTFTLPDLRGTAAVCTGQALQGGQLYQRGTRLGVPEVTLQPAQMPSHNHVTHRVNIPGDHSNKSSGPSSTSYPAAVTFLTTPTTGTNWATTQTPAAPNTTLNASSIMPQGGGQPHGNAQPVLGLNFCICILGEYPVPD